MSSMMERHCCENANMNWNLFLLLLLLLLLLRIQVVLSRFNWTLDISNMMMTATIAWLFWPQRKMKGEKEREREREEEGLSQKKRDRERGRERPSTNCGYSVAFSQCSYTVLLTLDFAFFLHFILWSNSHSFWRKIRKSEREKNREIDR